MVRRIFQCAKSPIQGRFAFLQGNQFEGFTDVSFSITLCEFCHFKFVIGKEHFYA